MIKAKTTKCQYGHQHESFQAARRCTLATRERDVKALILAHQIQKALLVAAPLAGDPFANFRG